MKRLIPLALVLLLAAATRPVLAWCPYIDICEDACAREANRQGNIAGASVYTQCRRQNMDNCEVLAEIRREQVRESYEFTCVLGCYDWFCGFPET